MKGNEKELEAIKQAVDHLLEADLREENGWTEEDIKTLEKISERNFEIIWRD